MSQMTKKADDGIMITLPEKNKVDLNVSITMDRLLRNGIDPNQITNPQQVDNAINMINSRMVNRAIPADSDEGREITKKLFGKQKASVFDMEGNKIPEGSGIMGGKSVKELMDSGQVTKGARGMKKSKKVQDREMFQAANERLTSDVDSIVKDIKSMEPITAMKEANSVIARKGKYKNLTQEQSKKILQDTEDHIFERNLPEDPEDFASGGRAGFRNGNTVEDKIKEMIKDFDKYRKGGGKISYEKFKAAYIPENFASGGIARAPFVGGGMGRRGFLKLLGSLGAGAAAIKTGILGLGGKQAGKEVVKEVAQSAGSGTPPPYFFKLAEKIKMLGDDATATTDRTIAKTLKSKDGKSTYLLEEDITSGDTIIKKINKEGDEMITDVEIMELRKGEVVKGKDGKAMRTPDEYEEVTEANMRIEGDVFNDPYYTDGIQIDEIIKEVGEQAPSIKKASGGIARMLGE